MEIQATKEYYGASYDELEKFICYWNQKDIILKSGFKDKILEIGKGNGFLPYYLKRYDIHVTTLDHNPELEPNIVLGIEDLEQLKTKWDMICMFDVIEHIPFPKITSMLGHISRLLNEKGIFTFHTPHMPLPLPNRPLHNGQHYWEFGKWGYSKRKIESILKRFFTIENCYRSRTEIFYVLRKK